MHRNEQNMWNDWKYDFLSFPVYNDYVENVYEHVNVRKQIKQTIFSSKHIFHRLSSNLRDCVVC